jgi:hypothetical protein
MKASVLSGSYLSTAKYSADPKKPISSPWARGDMSLRQIALVHELAAQDCQSFDDKVKRGGRFKPPLFD